jgi:hypothetical protein
MTNPIDDLGNVQVDFAWGNVPMQPNDGRGTNVLDPVLDSHEIVYLGWNGFPGYVPNTTSGNTGSGAGSGSGSGGGTSFVTIPAPNPGEDANFWAQRVANTLGLNMQFGGTAFNTLGAEYNFLLSGSMPVVGSSVPVGSNVVFSSYGEYVAPPSGLVINLGDTVNFASLPNASESYGNYGQIGVGNVLAMTSIFNPGFDVEFVLPITTTGTLVNLNGGTGGGNNILVGKTLTLVNNPETFSDGGNLLPSLLNTPLTIAASRIQRFDELGYYGFSVTINDARLGSSYFDARWTSANAGSFTISS